LSWRIVLVVVLVLVIEPALIRPKIEDEDEKELSPLPFAAPGNEDDFWILNNRCPTVELQHRLTKLPANYRCDVNQGVV
jgi:hypothetical protein